MYPTFWQAISVFLIALIMGVAFISRGFIVQGGIMAGMAVLCAIVVVYVEALARKRERGE